MRVKHFAGIVAGFALLISCTSKGTVPAVAPAFVADRTAPGAANATPCSSKQFLISGTGTNATLDNFVTAFMCRYGVPNAQFAVSSNRATVFSHAYTYQGKAISIVTTRTIMRLASNTKPWTGAAIYTLVRSKKIQLQWKVFKYLGLTKPLPSNEKVDPRVYNITIKNMLDATAGWDNDPSFEMRQTAEDLELTQHVNQTQYVRYQLWQPLGHDPGSYYEYCNFCYDVLGMVVAKASGMSFAKYLNTIVPGGGIAISPTINRLRNEVAQYYSRKRGFSAYYPTLMTKVPAPYGGDGGVLEIAQGDGGTAASAETELAFTNAFTLDYGQGPPPPPGKTAFFEGGIAGTATWAEQLSNCTNFVFDVNSDEFGGEYVFRNYQAKIAQYLKKTYRCG